ncbi:tripartite tricarboxylate transporter substrate-binding protein [Polaromonas jejuensis]|uniref:Tripartite tricarboxylate transporter substrate-binding protein n=1 Tax=Polaromonas jejuensis TaxID=457502 RepID=A0ABW0QAP5_9BURK|nr:tripartite tricarboxylate transporter substrate-binding protein [Polaromonas jejuensis]
MHPRSFFSRSLINACAALALAFCACASAQVFPLRPLRIIVPFPAGGAQDILARTLADGLAARFKQPVIVENRPGAAGNIGAEVLAKAAPDGYTLGILSGVHAANAAFYRKLSYSLERDFVPVSALGDSAVLIVASNQVPFKTIGEMLAYGKANPGKLNFGSTTSLTIDLLKVQTGVDVTMVTYKGLGDALQDLIGGRIDLGAGPSPQLIPLVKEGRIKALGLASRKRIAELPGVATVAETIDGYDAGMWYGLFAPVGTPPALVSLIAHETAQILSSKSTRDKLLMQGIDPAFSTASPQAIRERIQTETARWRKVAARTGNYAN